MTYEEAVILLVNLKEFCEFCGGETGQREAQAIDWALDQLAIMAGIATFAQSDLTSDEKKVD